MRSRIISKSAAMIVGLLIANVFTTVSPASAQEFLSSAEIKKVLSGSTVQSNSITRYYYKDGSFHQDGQRGNKEGRWWVKRPNKICHELPMRKYCRHIKLDGKEVYYYNIKKRQVGIGRIQ